MGTRLSAVVSLVSAIIALLCLVYVATSEREGGEGQEDLDALKTNWDAQLTDLRAQIAKLDEQERTTDPGDNDAQAVANRFKELEARVDQLKRVLDEDERDPIARGYAYLSSVSGEVRKQGVRMLRKLGGKDPEIIAQLRKMLDDYDPNVRIETLEGLKDAEDYDAIPQIAQLLSDDDASVREKVTQVLSDLLKNDAAMEQHFNVPQAMTALLMDESAQVREAVADAIGELAYASAVPNLITALEDPASDVREEVIESLVKLDARSAVPALQALYEKVVGESQEGDRLRIAAAMNVLGENSALQQETTRLTHAVTHGADADVREYAIRALAQFGGRRHAEVFEQALRDPDPRVRRAAEKALSRRKD